MELGYTRNWQNKNQDIEQEVRDSEAIEKWKRYSAVLYISPIPESGEVCAALEARQEREDNEPQSDDDYTDDTRYIKPVLGPSSAEDASIEVKDAELYKSQGCIGENIPCYLKLESYQL